MGFSLRGVRVARMERSEIRVGLADKGVVPRVGRPRTPLRSMRATGSTVMHRRPAVQAWRPCDRRGAERLAFARRARDRQAGAIRRSGEAAMNDVTTETTRQFKWVGTRPVRPDGVPKVTGRAQYGADLAMPGMLVGRILRSPHAHARIRSIDIAKAAALPGVKAVVTSADVPEQPFAYVGPERVAQNFWHITRNIMAREKVLYEGHAVAAVAAGSAAIADQALSLIEVDYEVLPHVIDVDA